MSDLTPGHFVAIVDYGLGNLFSVQQACAHAGLNGVITSSATDVDAAEAVIVPGVGAFGVAMHSLRQLGLVEPLRQAAQSGRPLVGICLGMQLLLSTSEEFGSHEGLDVIPGSVVRLREKQVHGSDSPASRFKVPQMGWNRIHKPVADEDLWSTTLLRGIPEGTFMYFVHSYYARPSDQRYVIALSRYADLEYASAVRSGNVFGFQFHPERSGSLGLRVYRNLKEMIETRQG